MLKNGANQNLPDAKGTYPLEYVIKLKLNSISIKLIETNKIDFKKKVKSFFQNSKTKAKWKINLRSVS